MPPTSAQTQRCPICRKPVQGTDADFPFCSGRCRTIDLGKWASGDYVISSPVTDADDQIQEYSPDNSTDKD